MRIVFFGAGNYGKDAWKRLEMDDQPLADKYLAFADNDPDLWGKDFCGKKVINPLDIETYNPDVIVITSVYSEAIRRQLINELRISERKIYSYGDYLRKCHAEQTYRNKYKYSYSGREAKMFNSQSMVVYTAITGNYDTLKEPLLISDGLTYVCITNNPDIKSNVWNMEYIREDSMDNVHLARHIKMNPQEFFPEYETSIWVDGKYQILDDLRIYVEQYQRQSPVLCFPHPERNCICDEAAACITNHLDRKDKIIFQISDYLQSGFPLDYGLYETGCIVRSHNDISVKMLMKKWENEIVSYSIRDQLSFPYICWKSGFVPDICDLDINRNRWLLQRRNLY